MPRKREYADRIQVSVRLTPDLYERARREANAREISLSKFISAALERHFERKHRPRRETDTEGRPWQLT